MRRQMKESYEVVVCGGGLAGICAGIASARHGARTCIIQDRPVFGGNSSSEIRVAIHGAAAFHGYARETGILSELLIEERRQNHADIFTSGWTNSVWDMTMYDLAMNTPNLFFHMNTTVLHVNKTDDRTISSVVALVANAETEITVEGKLFIDCTGDGVVADLAGFEWRMGTEARSEFGEWHAPEEASKDTMGSSIHFKTVNMGKPVPFKAPDWAIKHEDPGYFYKKGRRPAHLKGGYWWIEIGVPWNTIHEAEDIRHELTRHTLGIWDWIKNKDPELKELAANYALDWIGQVPGKRESRRIMGQYVMTEHDPVNRTVFEDEIAFGGWYIDLHKAGGLLADSIVKQDRKPCGPYGIPLRILVAKDGSNLMMAGRNVSVTHVALGSVRIMGTTALLGQAAGTAAAYSLQRGIPITEAHAKGIGEIKQLLLRDGCFLPNARNEDPLDAARLARASSSSEAVLHSIPPVGEEQADAQDRLLHRRGQWIAVSAESLNQVWVCLSNDTAVEQKVEAWLLPVDHIWDYEIKGKQELASTMLTVPPGSRQWIEWKVALGSAHGLQQGQYVRLDVSANPDVIWHQGDRLEPGHLAAHEFADGVMRRYQNGVTMSFRVEPEQCCYGAENVVSGVARPYQYTNLWRSDPEIPLPQWLELQWGAEMRIGQVELTFPGHLLKEYHEYPAMYEDPQCPKDYRIEAWIEGQWQVLLRVEGNYQRQRKHTFEAVTTNRMRIVIEATNGDPSAAIYEIRCYE